MIELPVHTDTASNSAVVVCNCGGIIGFDVNEIKAVSKKILQCEICKTQILVTDAGPAIHGE